MALPVQLRSLLFALYCLTGQFSGMPSTRFFAGGCKERVRTETAIPEKMFCFLVVFLRGAISIKLRPGTRDSEVTNSAFYYLISSAKEIMAGPGLELSLSLAQRVEDKIRQFTHGRIRNLVVEEIQGQVIVSGRAPSHHAKQLALHGALELLSGDCFAERITVG
jgi:hypothetical protein